MNMAILGTILAGSAFFTRSAIQKLKKYPQFAQADALDIAIVSYVINFILTLAASLIYANYNGVPVDHLFVHAMIATIASALYHDFQSGITGAAS